ncbi:MAG: hypothetical protein EBS35_05380 [Bacteroidetes bacterium]|nr:hypothetical protein [Bacteroidota bacterium]
MINEFPEILRFRMVCDGLVVIFNMPLPSTMAFKKAASAFLVTIKVKKPVKIHGIIHFNVVFIKVRFNLSYYVLINLNRSLK